MKILVVDDSPSIRAVMRYIIHHEGWELTEATSSEQALELYSQNPDFDLVIIDHGSLRLQGLKTLEYIRNLGFQGKSIVISLDHRGQFIEEVKNLGISSWLHKPFSNEHFCQAVHHAMGKPVILRKSA